MSLCERLADVARFMVRPTFRAEPMAWGRGFVAAWAVLFALTVLLVPLLGVLIDLPGRSAGVLPEPVAPRLGASEWVWPLLFAPVLEELLMRGWLTGRVAALRFAAWGFAALALLLADRIGNGVLPGWLPLLAVGLVFAGLVQWGLTRQRDTRVPQGFVRHFPAVVWVSALVFGLLHLGNFGPLPTPVGVLVVVPQAIGGMLLAYTRTRLGLVAAIVQHALFNAVHVTALPAF